MFNVSRVLSRSVLGVTDPEQLAYTLASIVLSNGSVVLASVAEPDDSHLVLLYPMMFLPIGDGSKVAFKRLNPLASDIVYVMENSQVLSVGNMSEFIVKHYETAVESWVAEMERDEKVDDDQEGEEDIDIPNPTTKTFH